MSNRGRQQRAAKLGDCRAKITNTDKLRTLDLYLRYGSSLRAGEELGISPAAVRDRLYALGVQLPPHGRRNIDPRDVNDPAVIARIRRELAP